jgi:hypothetical protein
MLIDDKVGARVSNFAYVCEHDQKAIRSTCQFAGKGAAVGGRAKSEEGGGRKERSREIL